MNVQLGRGRLARQLAELRPEELLLFDGEVLVAEEDDTTLRD
jgi:hypothetical protein